jgi:uncharacterized protein YllA (UPF0747 family)
MFNRSTETKIAVLEERLTSYEVMMKKIDEAIQIMGKTSQNISKMLAVHEERLENTGKSDDLIIERIKTIEVKNTEEHGKVIEKFESLEEKIDKRIESLDKKVEEMTKYRWIVVGALILLSYMFSNSHIVVDLLTPNQEPARIERVK